MSLARQHRDKFREQSETAVAPQSVSGLAEDSVPPMVAASAGRSLARAHRDRVLAQTAATVHVERAVAEVEEPAEGSLAVRPAAAPLNVDAGSPEERATAMINLRMQHDLRRLRDIQSIEGKIAAKHEMLPEYAAWVEGLVAAGVGVAEDVLPTIMIWRIDTGDFPGALLLAEHVLEHNVPLPARYERTAPGLIVEEIATAALKAQQAGESFDFDILARSDMLTADADMHDQIRAKLKKAIGVEQMRRALNEAGDAITNAPMAVLAMETLARARALDQRVGVTDRIKKLTKLLPKEPPVATG